MRITWVTRSFLDYRIPVYENLDELCGHQLTLIFNGEVRSLRRFQDDVKEVRQGMECGIRLDNFLDFVEGDVIQFYEIELKKASL